MTIDHERSGDVDILRLRGKLDAAEDQLVATATGVLKGRGSKLLLDLGDVPFINSMGIGELVRVVAQANLQEARVVLARPTAFVAGVLSMTQLDRFFDVQPTVEAALARFAP